MRVWLMVAAVCLCAAPARVQQDANGSKDHPMFSRMPVFYIESHEVQDFSSVELDTEPPEKIEGRYWKISYGLKEGARKSGPVQIAGNYTDLMAERGGRKLLDAADANGGTTVASMPIEGKNIFAQIWVNSAGDSYDLTVVEEAGMEQKVEFALHNVLFDTGKAMLEPESAAAPVGALLKNDAALQLEIQGHTDNAG